MGRLSVRMEVTGPGWLRADLRHDDATASITASYISDAPRDLVIAACHVATGESSTSCEWQEEPGDYRWDLARIDDLLEIEIVRIDPPATHRDAGVLAFSTRVEPVAFVRSVLRAMDDFDDSWGNLEYHETWGFAFPTAEVETLRRLLAAMPTARVTPAGR